MSAAARKWTASAILRGCATNGMILGTAFNELVEGYDSWGRVGSTGAVSDGLQAEVAAALAKNGGEQVTGEREFALAA